VLIRGHTHTLQSAEKTPITEGLVCVDALLDEITSINTTASYRSRPQPSLHVHRHVHSCFRLIHSLLLCRPTLLVSLITTPSKISW